MTSPSATTPRSPCNAFKEFKTTAGEPVLVSVAASFSPMCPLFPTPMTTILLRRSTAVLTSSTAREKLAQLIQCLRGIRAIGAQDHRRAAVQIRAEHVEDAGSRVFLIVF